MRRENEKLLIVGRMKNNYETRLNRDGFSLQTAILDGARTNQKVPREGNQSRAPRSARERSNPTLSAAPAPALAATAADTLPRPLLRLFSVFFSIRTDSLSFGFIQINRNRVVFPGYLDRVYLIFPSGSFSFRVLSGGLPLIDLHPSDELRESEWVIPSAGSQSAPIGLHSFRHYSAMSWPKSSESSSK